MTECKEKIEGPPWRRSCAAHGECICRIAHDGILELRGLVRECPENELHVVFKPLADILEPLSQDQKRRVLVALCVTLLQWIGWVSAVAYLVFALTTAFCAITERRMPHRWEHWLRMNRCRTVRCVLENGCEWVCAECVDCGKVRLVAHAVYCDGCGRKPA